MDPMAWLAGCWSCQRAMNANRSPITAACGYTNGISSRASYEFDQDTLTSMRRLHWPAIAYRNRIVCRHPRAGGTFRYCEIQYLPSNEHCSSQPGGISSVGRPEIGSCWLREVCHPPAAALVKLRCGDGSTHAQSRKYATPSRADISVGILREFPA